MNTCATCTHYEPPEPSTSPWSFGYGKCRLLMGAGGEPSRLDEHGYHTDHYNVPADWPKDRKPPSWPTAFPCDASCYHAEFRVQPDFGCVLHTENPA